MKKHILWYLAVLFIAGTMLYCKNGNTGTQPDRGKATEATSAKLPAARTDSLFGIEGCERAGFQALSAKVRKFTYQNFSVQITDQDTPGEKIQVIMHSNGKVLDVPDGEPVYFAGAARDHIFIDVGTGPDKRELIIFNLKLRTLAQTYRTPYYGDLSVASNGTLWFYAPVDEKEVTKKPDCPEKEEWLKKGQSIGYGQRRLFNLPTRGLTRKSEFICIPLQ